MRKITTIIALILCAVSMTVSAQTKELPGHRARPFKQGSCGEYWSNDRRQYRPGGEESYVP